MTWLANFIAEWATSLFGVQSVTGAVILIGLAAAIALYVWAKKRKQSGKRALEAWHLILFGAAGTWLCLTATLAGAAWLFWSSDQHIAATADQDEGPLRWSRGINLLRNGDKVVRIRMKGSNFSPEEVELKSAYLVSAVNGTRLPLLVDAGADGLLTVDQVSLVPPGAPINVVAQFDLLEKDFLETWRHFYLNAEDHKRRYRLYIDESQIAGLFPGMVGPRVSRKRE